jgi:hypothetical protein
MNTGEGLIHRGRVDTPKGFLAGVFALGIFVQFLKGIEMPEFFILQTPKVLKKPIS